MKQSNMTREQELFPGSSIVRRFSATVAGKRDKSAHLWVRDCFTCRSPQSLDA